MKLYNGKLIRKGMQKAIKGAVESRDAILWSIDTVAKKAIVKIQGSDQYITAYYPENWQSGPAWLKPGNSVRISHTGGVRGRVELVGNGALVPTPVSGNRAPDPTVPIDAIVSGLTVVPAGGMNVDIAAGSVRFSGEISAVSTATKTIDTAPTSGQFRYDKIVVGPDLTIDYVKGTAAASPSMPATPSGHLLCAWVLIPPDKTTILASYINNTFVARHASSLTMAIADGDLAWDELSTTVTITIKDQYNDAFSTSGTMSLVFVIGNGTISDSGAKAFSGSSVTFTYTRNQEDPGDISPTLRASLNGIGLIATGSIILRDASDGIMY